jgi:4-amino-4-deoxy-L-arabinose transferase-like glycosyltransferase
MTTSLCSDEPLRGGIRRVLQNQWFITVALLVTTMAVRWAFHIYNPRPSGFFIYHGAPLSDGYSYTYKAISIANGYGIPPYQQPAIRPFYSIVLACLYTWTGFSLRAVTALNIVIAGATAALIYLCGALVFNRLYGLAAALFFAIDPTQVIQTPQAGTEPLGLLFFVASVYTAMLAFQSGAAWMFCLSGLLIGLSNLTRTLTILALPFYIVLILFFGWREPKFKSGAARALFMLLGFSCVMLPWSIRQERLYGIASISDNIGEAIYAATSRVYKKWTPLVRKDADAAGIPNTIGDRYRYFMDRAVENVKVNSAFYIRNVSAALWEYANTFGLKTRSANEYRNSFSSTAQGQNLLLVYLLVFTIAMWLLCKGSPLALPNLVFLLSSIGLIVFYRTLPAWAAFFPMVVGIICSFRLGSRLPVLILLGSLLGSVLGSAIFANPVLFRTILMTDWLFLFFLLAAIWFPAGIVSRKLTGNRSVSFLGEEEAASVFQKALSSIALRFLIVFLAILLGFFAVSSARLIVLTISQNRKGHPTRFGPEWALQRGRLKLTIEEKRSVLWRLQRPPLSVLPQGEQQFPIYSGGKDAPSLGTYVVEVDGFYYDYYIPAGEFLWHPMLKAKPYGRTLARLSRFDFVIPGEVPSDFAGRPLLFVGIVVPLEVMDGEQTNRPWVRGLAIIPMDNSNHPNYARAVCAPPIL